MPEETEKPYAVLGIHGEDVETVNVPTDELDAQGKPIVIQRNVVRVRMFVDGKVIDEDITLPRIITIEEQVDDTVMRRIAEIKSLGTTDPEKSDIVPEQTEQIVTEVKQDV